MQELIATGCFHSALPDGRATLGAVRRAKADGALVIDAGDFFSGSAFYAFSEGRVEQRLLAELYDVVVPGNHDLADLMRLTDPLGFPPVVCANLRPPAAFRGRWVSGLTLRGSTRVVGIVGYLGAQAFEAIPKEERDGFDFRPPTADLIAAEAEALRREGAEIVIGVSHSGFLDDVADQEAGWPLDTVIAAHCHSPWSHWADGSRHVAKPPASGKGLLRLRIGGNGLESISQHLNADGARDFDDRLDEDLAGFSAWGAERLAALHEPLPDRDSVARRLVGRGLAAAGTGSFLLNTYTLRGGLPGTVTRRDLFRCAPFDSELVILDAGHQVEDLILRARELGEDVTASATTPAGPHSIATTRYLAGRLAVAFRPLDPPCSLHDLLIDLAQESR
ncbi:metallophosphoesterase [Streptomyces sp. NPDC088745]|uniref:metallophosphoesterase n=1 Tax=Streptomyces sp. NPDC088745 TaxID=3365884 RepID=UPI0037FAC0D7